MLAYHSDATIKSNILTQLQAHHDADEIIQGRHWEDGKGCAVGCTIYSDEHAEYERLFGIPAGLARLEDTIFESLPNSDAMGWPLRFMNAIAPGADLALVEPKFIRWVLDSIILPNADADGVVKAAIRGTIEVFDAWIATGEEDENARRAAHRAAYVAYAAGAAGRAAGRAAWSGVVAADSAAEVAAYCAMADKLIELLEAA